MLILISSLPIYSQVTGKVTDEKGTPLPYVNIYTESGQTGTTTNDEGLYELKLSKAGDYVLVFQFLGYKTLKKSISSDAFPVEINVSLKAENTSLDEVVVNSNENPANRIIRAAIKTEE